MNGAAEIAECLRQQPSKTHQGKNGFAPAKQPSVDKFEWKLTDYGRPVAVQAGGRPREWASWPVLIA
jgi:hypothetical protein